VSVKLTPESCINNASRNGRLTAAGRQAKAVDSHSQTCLQTLFFSLSLPLMRKQWNYTWMLKNLLKLYCIWTWDTLWVFFCVCAVLFYVMLPLWWDNYRTTSEAPSPGLEAEEWTPKLLRLKLHCIWTWRICFIIIFFYFVLFYFIFIYTFFFHLLILYFYSYFTLFIFNLLCLSNAF
jgi:hypothetical protein